MPSQAPKPKDSVMPANHPSKLTRCACLNEKFSINPAFMIGKNVPDIDNHLSIVSQLDESPACPRVKRPPVPTSILPAHGVPQSEIPTKIDFIGQENTWIATTTSNKNSQSLPTLTVSNFVMQNRKSSRLVGAARNLSRKPYPDFPYFLGIIAARRKSHVTTLCPLCH